jgi:hypothetical protein
MWSIRYRDNSTLDSTEVASVRDIPFEKRYGVLWILQGPGEDRLFNKNHYLWIADNGCWTEHDEHGLTYELARAAHLVECYLQGAVVPMKPWKECQEEMTRAHREWQGGRS